MTLCFIDMKLCSVGRKLKTDDGQTNVHAIFWSHTYIRPSSVGPMAASAVEPPSVEITTTLAVTITATLFIVPNSLLSFNLEENGFMNILRAS